MLRGRFESAGSYLKYGGAGWLFSVDELDATVLQYRDAELVLDNVDASDVIVIAPASFVTIIYLGERAHSAIPIDSLSTSVRAQLANELDAPLDGFEFIQIGKWHNDSPDRSLAEFADA